MTDKVQKIREFLVGIAEADGVNTILAKAIEKKILPYMDSLQEEPKKCMYALDDFNDEDRKVTCDGCEENCKYAQKEEPVSDELEKAAEQDVCEVVNTCSATGIPNDHIPSWVQDAMINEFIHGAKWQMEKMMEKAVDGEIGYWNLRGLSINTDLPRSVSEGDNVKIIVIKGD